MNERSPISDQLTVQRLLIIREEIDKSFEFFSDPNERMEAANVLRRDNSTILGYFKEMTPEIESDLGELKDIWNKQGLSSSSVYLTARYLENITMDIFGERKRKISFPNKSSYKWFCVFFDCALGSITITNSIVSAEDVVRGNFEADLSRSLDDPSFNRDPTKVAEVLLKAKKDANGWSKLLIQDPTGRSLVERVVKSIEEHGAPLKFLTKDFYLEGARFAQEGYDLILPLANQVASLPPKPLL